MVLMMANLITVISQTVRGFVGNIFLLKLIVYQWYFDNNI